MAQQKLKDSTLKRIRKIMKTDDGHTISKKDLLRSIEYQNSFKYNMNSYEKSIAETVIDLIYSEHTDSEIYTYFREIDNESLITFKEVAAMSKSSKKNKNKSKSLEDQLYDAVQNKQIEGIEVNDLIEQSLNETEEENKMSSKNNNKKNAKSIPSKNIKEDLKATADEKFLIDLTIENKETKKHDETKTKSDDKKPAAKVNKEQLNAEVEAEEKLVIDIIDDTSDDSISKEDKELSEEIDNTDDVIAWFPPFVKSFFIISKPKLFKKLKKKVK